MLQPVKVRLPLRAVARRKLPVRLPRPLDHDIGSGSRLFAARAMRSTGMRAVGEEIHDLPVGMDARISPSGRRELDAVPEEQRQLFLQDILHRGHRRRLPLKAMIAVPS
jgi:hypothetical protein